MTAAIAAASVAVAGTVAATAIQAKNSSKAGKIADKQAALAQQEADLAREQYEYYAPQRDLGRDLMERFLNVGEYPAALAASGKPEDYGLAQFLQGGERPAVLQPAARPAVPSLLPGNRDILERQFQVARDRTLANAPALGGSLAGSLTDLDAERALGVSQLYINENNRQALQQYDQDLQAAQASDALAKSLYGIGLDRSGAQWSAEDANRKALLATALGIPTQQAQAALGGLAQAGAGFGNAASATLAGSQGLERTLGGVADFGASVLGQQLKAKQLKDILGGVPPQSYSGLGVGAPTTLDVYGGGF